MEKIEDIVEKIREEQSRTEILPRYDRDKNEFYVRDHKGEIVFSGAVNTENGQLAWQISYILNGYAGGEGSIRGDKGV